MPDVEREIHPSHAPEPEDGPRLYPGGRTCRRCMFFVAMEGAFPRVTDTGAKPCRPFVPPQPPAPTGIAGKAVPL